MENELEEQGMQLLRLMNERQAKGSREADVFPHEVAHEVGLDPQSSEYEELLDDMKIRGLLVDRNISGGLRIASGGWARLAEED